MATKKYDLDTIDGVKAYLSDLNINNPTDSYSSRYATDISKTIDGIRDSKYEYSADKDPTYKAYAKRYKANAQNAAKDVMASAAGLTGGYGNSYGQTAASQAYSTEMQKLADIIPELENNAYSRYQNELSNSYNKLNILQNADSTDYSRYRDKQSDYQIKRNEAIQLLQNAISNDYNNRLFEHQKEQDAISNDYNNRLFEYQQSQDAISNDYNNRLFEYQQSQDAISNDYNNRLFEYQQSQDAISNDYNNRLFEYQQSQDAVSNYLKYMTDDNENSTDNANSTNKGLLSNTEYRNVISMLEGVIANAGKNDKGTLIYDNLMGLYDNEYINDRDITNLLLYLGVSDVDAFIAKKGKGFVK